MSVAADARAPWKRQLARGSRRVALELGCLGVVPAVLAALVVRYLVPAGGAGLPGLVARAAHGRSLYLGAVLFLAFGAMARYWLTQVAHDEFRAAGDARASRGLGALRLVAGVAAAVIAALAMRAYLMQSYRVVGESMLPTLAPDDLVLGVRTHGLDVTHAGRGEPIVFRGAMVRPPPGAPLPDILVKRIIGVPGDRIEMSGSVPIINGWPVPSCDVGDYAYVSEDGEGRSFRGRLRVEFLEDQTYLTVHTLGGPRFPDPYLVQPGEAFVLGDNRGNSLDSRMFGGGRGGGVPAAAVDARVRFFLAGTHRSGDTDLGRFLHPVDTLQERIHLEGLDTTPLEQGIAQCLAKRPTDTHPPRAL